MDRVRCKPWGLQGGHSGAGNSVAIARFGAERETHFPNGKAFNQVLKPGDAYILRSGGGGGFGTPLERDVDALERDVRAAMSAGKWRRRRTVPLSATTAPSIAL